MGFSFSNLWGGGNSGVSEVELPKFKADPFVGKTQDFLFPYSQNLLEGDIPDYYKSIGDTSYGGETFQKFLDASINDITRVTEEASAAKGIRGPRSAAAVSDAVSRVAPALRYQDMVDSLNRGNVGKQFLMSSGLNTMGGVRSGALSLTGMENTHNLNRAKLEMQKEMYNDEFDKEQMGNFMGTFKSVLPAAMAPFTGGASLGLYGIPGVGGVPKMGAA